MAVSFTYNTTFYNVSYIFRATGGGVTFSANLVGTSFDYFTDTAVVDDAIYFSCWASNKSFSDLKVNVGTALAGTGVTGVWEYRTTYGWETMHNMTDPTNGFTTTGPNIIVFPIQAGMSASYPLNGVSAYSWIRYRITAGTITEGGANQTTQPTTSNGMVDVLGGTDGSPATFKMLYDWVIVNAPQIDASNPNTSTFKFNNMIINIASRLKSTNEQIFIGNGATSYPQYISYLECGTKAGADGWLNETNMFFCISAGTNYLVTTSNTKYYGGTIGGFTNYVNGNNRYHSSYSGLSYGEWVGTTIQDKTGYFTDGTNMNKITVTGAIISPVFPTNYPTNMRISDPKNYIWGVYDQGGTAKGVSYALPSTAIVNWNQYGGEGISINLINPDPSLPEQTGTPKILSRVNAAPTANLNKCFYNDVSAGTFTDYTSQSQDVTVDDIPLSGDVGDCYYFLYNTIGSYYQVPYEFTITNQSNDYVYIWEYSRASTWYPMEKTWDGTNNFTTSGRIYHATTNAWQNQTVNGVAGYWHRLRIVNKGINSPVCSQIKASNQTGIGDWRINEKYEGKFTIVDKDGLPIEGVTITLIDTDLNTYNFTTDINGETSLTEFLSKYAFFNPLIESDTNYNVGVKSSNPYNLTISKTGYIDYTSLVTINNKFNNVLKLAALTDADENYSYADTYPMTYDEPTNTLTVIGDATLGTISNKITWDHIKAFARWKRGEEGCSKDGYIFKINIMIGNGVDNVYVEDSNKTLQIGESDKLRSFRSMTNTDIIFNNMSCLFYSTTTAYDSHDGNIEFHDCSIDGAASPSLTLWTRGTGVWNNVTYSTVRGVWGASGSWNRITLVSPYVLYLMSSSTTVNDLIAENMLSSDAPYTPIFRNCIFKGSTYLSQYTSPTYAGIKTIDTLIDCYPLGASGWQGYTMHANGVLNEIHRKYTFNLKAIDWDNRPIPNVRVLLRNKDNETIFDLKTDTQGQIPEQEVLKAYYDINHVEHDQGDFTLKITANGYETYKSLMPINSKTELTITLKNRREI